MVAAAHASAATSALIKRTVTDLDLAAGSILLFDYFLTIPDEVQLVWKSRWSLGKILFFLTRYPPFIDTTLVLVHQFAILSAKECGYIFRCIGFMLGAGVGIAEIILVMRTIVIWRRNKVVIYLLPIILILFWIPLLYFLNEALSSLVFGPAPRPNDPGCFLVTQKNILYVCFILILCFETLVLSLTVFKAVGQFRHANSALVVVLFRDGIMNYIYLFILSVINVVILLTAPHGYTTLLTALQRVMHSVLSARILLNLRGAKEGEKTEILMLKPTSIFRSKRPFSTGQSAIQHNFGIGSGTGNETGSGLAFANSQIDSNLASSGFNDGSMRKGHAYRTSTPYYFPHPDDPESTADAYVPEKYKVENKSASVLEEWFGDGPDQEKRCGDIEMAPPKAN